jgi:hypothetical protein
MHFLHIAFFIYFIIFKDITNMPTNNTIDKTQAYHIGASLKDLGKKVFAFSKIDSDLLRWVD